MEKHTSNFNNVHTQLLLQMHIDSNIQEMKDSLSSTQNELQSTKTTLVTTQNELQTTKTTLDTTQNELQTTKTTLDTTQNELQTTKTTLDTTQNELQTTKTTLDTTQNELQTTKTTLDTTQNELQTTKTTLDTTQNELQTTKTMLVTTQNELQITKTTLVSTQNELQTTKTTLDTTQNELQTTKMKLKQTMDELNHSKEDATKKENEINFLQENIQKGVENIQKQNENGFKLNHQITESFATFCSTVEQNQDPLKIFFKSLETKQQINQVDPIKPIEPIEINGRKLEFSKVNDLVQNLNPYESYEKNYAMLLKKMENGKIHHIDDKQLIFKVHLPKNHRKLYIVYYDIALTATNYAKYVVVKNDQLVLLDNVNNNNDYQIYLQIPNYNNDNSKSYLHQKIENGEKLLLKYTWNYNINIDEYKTPSNEVLFYVTK